jgi:hypothetical protein
MAEVTQYAFSWTEVAEALIKKQDIHEGEWTPVVEFAFTVGVLGPNPKDSRPGMMILGNSLQLVRAQPNSPPHLVVDAAKVNPKPVK